MSSPNFGFRYFLCVLWLAIVFVFFVLRSNAIFRSYDNKHSINLARNGVAALDLRSTADLQNQRRSQIVFFLVSLCKQLILASNPIIITVFETTSLISLGMLSFWASASFLCTPMALWEVLWSWSSWTSISCSHARRESRCSTCISSCSWNYLPTSWSEEYPTLVLASYTLSCAGCKSADTPCFASLHIHSTWLATYCNS